MAAFILDPKDPASGDVFGNLLRFLDQLPKSKPWKVEVKRYAKERSNPQCRYLNGVAYQILSEELGFERDDISEYLCGEHFGWVDVPKPGDRIEKVPYRTTTTGTDGKRSVLDWKEFDNYVEFIKRWAAEKGIYIPDPNMPREERRMAA